MPNGPAEKTAVKQRSIAPARLLVLWIRLRHSRFIGAEKTQLTWTTSFHSSWAWKPRNKPREALWGTPVCSVCLTPFSPPPCVKHRVQKHIFMVQSWRAVAAFLFLCNCLNLPEAVCCCCWEIGLYCFLMRDKSVSFSRLKPLQNLLCLLYLQ